MRAAQPGSRLRAVSLLVCLAMLASCARFTPRASAPPTLSVLLPPSERPFWDPIARAFEAAHPGVKVELVEGPQSTDLRESVYAASLLARDPTFDLVYLDVTWTPKFAAAGWLRALDDSFPSAEGANFLAPAWDAGRFSGHLYRVPVRTDMGILLYRSDILDSAGIVPPATYEQLASISRRLASPPQLWGYVWQGAQYEGLVCNFLEVLTGYGGYWIDPSTDDVGLDDPQAVAAALFLADCAQHGRISPRGVTTDQEEQSRRVFQDGHAVFLRCWPYAYRLSQQEGSPLRGRVGTILMPYTPGGHPVGTLGGWGLGVSAFSRHPDLAIAFVRFAVSAESQRTLCAPTGYAPALAAAYDDSVLLAANPFLKRFRSMHDHSVSRPEIARYAQASDILQRHLSAALTGMDDPKHAMEAAAEETRLLIGPRHPPREGG